MRCRAAGAAVVVGVAFVLLMPPFAHSFIGAAERSLQLVLCLATTVAYLLTAFVLSRGWAWWPWVALLAGALGLGTTLAFTQHTHHRWELAHLGANGPLHWFLSGATVVVATVPPLRAWVGSPPRQR